MTRVTPGTPDWADDLNTDLDGIEGAINDHVADTTAAHAASAISFSPTGTVAATTAQAAIAEVASEAATNLSDHAAATTSVHGIADTSALVTASALAPVATSGAYADLSGKPVLPVSRDAMKSAATSNTGTSLAADPDLSITLPVGTFDFEALVYFDGSVNNDAKFQLNFSGTATAKARTSFPRTSAAPTTGTNLAWDNGSHALGVQTGWGGTFSSAGCGGVGVELPFHIHGRIIVTVAGDLSISFAKQNNTDTGVDTRTLPFSTITAVERLVTP